MKKIRLGRIEKQILKAMFQWHKKGIDWLTLEQTALLQDNFGCAVYLTEKHKEGLHKGGSLDWHDWYRHKKRLERLVQKRLVKKYIKNCNTFYVLSEKAIKLISKNIL